MDSKICSNCGKSKVLQMEDGRYWCGWCGDYAVAVDAEEFHEGNRPDVAKMEEYLKTITMGDFVTWSSVRAAKAMEQLGKDAGPVLLRFMKHIDPRLRYAAVVALGNLDIESAITIPAILEALNDEDRAVHQIAQDHLIGSHKKIKPIKIDSTAQEAIPAVLKYMEKTADYETQLGWDILVRIGRFAVPTLVRLFEVGEKEKRLGAAKAIAEIGPKAEEAVPMLIKMLKGNEGCFRTVAAKVLEKIGSGAKAAIPALIEKLKDTTDCRDYCSNYCFCLPAEKSEFHEWSETFYSVEPDSFYQVYTRAAEALEKITGKNFGENMEKWQKWWEENKDKFLKKK